MLSTLLLQWAGMCIFILMFGVKSAPMSGNLVEAIKRAAVSLPEESLNGDATLIQQLDRINSLSSYSLRHGTKPLFVRKESDAGKSVVVLNPGEDHLIVTNFKRTFIVLKQSPLKATAYRVFYAYIRDAKPDDQSALNAGDSKIRIEFDNWDGRGSSKNPIRSLGWTTCYESIYPSCKDNILPHTKPVEIISLSEDLIVDYSGEDEGLSEVEGTNRVAKPRQPELRAGGDEGGSSYYDLFVDLDDTAEGQKYVHQTVGMFTYALSAATGISSPEALIASGINPTFPDKAEARDIKEMKLEDMKRSIVLFQNITNSSGPVEIPEKMLPQGQGRTMGSGDDNEDESEGPVDMERFKRLKAQYVKLNDELAKLSQLYPNTLVGGEPPAENTSVSEDLSPKKQLDEYKSKAIKLRDRIGDKGKTVEDAVLEQYEVGQELKDNPDDGQDLFNEEDPEKLIESEGQDDKSDLAKHLTKQTEKLKEISDKLRKIKKTERELKKKLKGKKKSGEMEKPKGGLLNGDLLGLFLGSNGLVGGGGGGNIGRRKRRKAQDTMIDSATNMAVNVGTSLLGVEGIMEIGSKALDAMTEEGEINKFSLVTGVAGNIIDQGFRKIPIVGQPLSMIGTLVGHTFTGVAGLFGFGLGRSIYGGDNVKASLDTDLFGHIGWRSSDINPEELYTQILAIEGEAPFVGFGNCPRMNLKLENFQEADMSETKIVNLFLSLIRTQCSTHQNKYILRLFKEGILSIDQDGTISLNQQSPLLNQGKWTKIESAELSSAFELSVFSKTILAEWKNPTAPVALDGSKITKSVHTFILAGINAIETASKILPNHFVKLVRNVELTLKTGFTELLQDYDRYKACSRCEGEIFQTATNDLRALYSLIQFIVNDGLRQVDLGTKDTRSAFKDFHELNRDSINEKLKSFL